MLLPFRLVATAYGLRSPFPVGKDDVRDPHTATVVGSLGKCSTPVGLEDGAKGGGHRVGLFDGQPEVGVAEERRLLPLLRLLVHRLRERCRRRPGTVDECERHGRCGCRPGRSGRVEVDLSPAVGCPPRPFPSVVPRGSALGEAVSLQELEVIRRRAGAQAGELGAFGRRQFVAGCERVDDRHPGGVGQRPNVPRIVEVHRVLGGRHDLEA